MSSLAFVTHPSVRIKGTENSYTPTQCLDERCPVKAPHLHCPFCVKTDAYQDPVILKAHYRVKHVDKGIEFAGLKILRCCDQCDIIGIIKGEKRFKGAHWHCYRCRNGFNRRDEAIKHYKTHFRNPQTTFQIQITQDLNSPPEVRSHEEHSSSQDAFASIENPVQEIIHPALSQTGISLTEQNVITTGAISTRHGAGVKKIKVKHELLGKDNSGDHEDEETIMIIQGDQLESAFASHIINSGELTVLNKTVDSNLSWEIRFRLEEEEKNIYKSKAEEYKAQVELLQQQVAELESQLAQQSQLKLHELIENLSSGDVSKQMLGQQLSKFLEHCQLQAHGTVAVIEDDSHLSVKQHEQIKHEEVIVHGLEHNAGSMTGELKTNGLVSQQLETSARIAHLNEISNGFRVVCTTSEGHVVVSHAPGSVVASSMAGEEAEISAEFITTCASTATIPASVCEGSEVLYTVMGAHMKEDVAGSALPQDEQGELAGVGEDRGCLMEVVAAADGLASLGTDIAEASSAQESQSAFVMDMDDGQRIIITAEDNSNSGEEESVELSQDVSTEPSTKRVKIT